MLLKSITLCCLILNTQSQLVYNPFINSDQLYFSDNRPQATKPFSAQNVQDLRKFQAQSQTKNTSPSIDIEKSTELAYGSIYEQFSNSFKQNVIGKETSTSIIPSTATAQQIVTERQNVTETAVVQDSTANAFQYSLSSFGLNLLKIINDITPGNAVVSPFSITTLLALLQQGAWAQTQEQITNALRMTPEFSASAFAQITGEFKSRKTRNILKSANNLYASNTFDIEPNFKKVARNSFNSEVTPISFARPELAAREINSWVSDHTNKKIDKLVSPDSLDVMTQVVLVNAIYFKGLWEYPFRVQSNVAREFILGNGQTKTINYMRTRKGFKTGVDAYTNAEVVILPFEKNEYSLMVILPSNVVGVTNTLSSLTENQLLSYLDFPLLDTELEIPKFTVRADTDLAPVLKNMGITNMFGQNSELYGVGRYRNASPHISSAVHSAVLSIDEQGGTAAAATAFAAVALSYDEPTVVFKANRPFIAVLWDVKNSLPLFMAKIEDPQQ